MHDSEREPVAPGPGLAGLTGSISVIATASVVHPEGADLSELPDPAPVVGADEKTETD